MNKDKISYLTLSDIHLGHNLNRTDNIISNLRQYFKDNHKVFKSLDMICLVGDIFDRLLMSGGKDSIQATEWLIELIIYCKSNKIALRILEGTPSHDWKQATLITSIIEKLNIDLDYKYVDTLHIERNTKLGINILYIPDEYRHKASETYKEVKELLFEHKLTKVDIAFIHGQFNYQLPILLDSSHSEQDYLDIVKYYISVGHIHTPSVYERILAQGSFDRLAHNEEEDKGGHLITIYKNGEMSFNFIKNKKAMIFKTYRFETEDLEEITKILDKEIDKVPIGSHIRIISSREDFISKNLKSLKDRYAKVVIKIEKPKKKDESNEYKVIDEVSHIESFQITKDNIRELMSIEMQKFDLSVEEKKQYDIELNQILSNVG